jgi:hypothetical protein
MGKGSKDRVNRDSKETRYGREDSRQEQKETREYSDGRAKAKPVTGAGGKGREYRVGREECNSNTVAKGSVNNSKGEMAAMGRKANGNSRGVCVKTAKRPAMVTAAMATSERRGNS